MNRPVGADESGRAARRVKLPVGVYRLGEEPSDDLRDVPTPEERIAMMWPLALEAWEVSGRPLPSYARSDAPVRITRLSEQGSD